MARERIRLFARWPVHRPGADDVVAASRLAETAHLSFWDAMVLTSAAAMGCDDLLTADLNAGQVIAGVRVVDPFADA